LKLADLACVGSAADPADAINKLAADPADAIEKVGG
jgi:hypothetical protein